MRLVHRESHLIERIGWLRAAVLGANDGIISTASLVVGVAAAATAPGDVMVAGVAGMVAGAMSMAAGEYVSVGSQADTENADMARERRELAEQPEDELKELADIYVKRGIKPDLARQVAEQLTAKGALEAHARDELGLSAHVTARPVQAALTSAATFSVGAALPLTMAMIAPATWTAYVVSGGSLVFLAILGAVGARVGGASILKPTVRVTFWGAFAMAATAAIGAIVGQVIQNARATGGQLTANMLLSQAFRDSCWAPSILAGGDTCQIDSPLGAALHATNGPEPVEYERILGGGPFPSAGSSLSSA